MRFTLTNFFPDPQYLLEPQSAKEIGMSQVPPQYSPSKLYRHFRRTDTAFHIIDPQGHVIATVVGREDHPTTHTLDSATCVVEFLNHPVHGEMGFDCKIEHRSNPYVLPPDDESMEEHTSLIGPDKLPLAYVSDYGQGVKLCELLNRELH
jgi:hypothetical protein